MPISLIFCRFASLGICLSVSRPQVPFELPAFEERYRMLTYYMSKYLLKADGGMNAATIVVDGVEDSHIKEAAEATKGFSGKNPRRITINTSTSFFL